MLYLLLVPLCLLVRCGKAGSGSSSSSSSSSSTGSTGSTGSSTRSTGSSSDGRAVTYTNPVVHSNTPDPGVLGTTADGPPFVAVTSSGFEIVDDVFPLRTSENLVDWKIEGALFPGRSHPRWATFPFYAPEIHGPIRGTGAARFWAVYDATENATGAMVIGAAWSASPTGPFTDLGAPLQRVYEPGRRSTTTHAPHIGGSAIDATLWQNRTDGRIYLLWKNKLSTGVRQIALQELTPSATPVPSLRPVASPPRVLLLATEAWEAHDVEGPFVWEEPEQACAKAKGKEPWLYLFYSGSNTWGSTYAIGVARSTSITGPWTKLGEPVAHTRGGAATENTTFVSPGHNSVVRKGGSTYLVYHANRWNETGLNCVRYMMVDRLVFGSSGWPQLATPDGAPSDAPEPMPRDVAATEAGVLTGHGLPPKNVSS